MATNQPVPLRSGGLLQSGISREPATAPGPYHGVVRGVVTATYVTDSPDHPMAQAGASPTCVYADVLVYGCLGPGSRFFFLPGAIVAQPSGGLQKGAIYKPRATSRLLSGKTLSDVTPQDVSQMDGDHVLVSFLEGHRNQPVIIGGLPHPSRDAGNNKALPAGQRQQLKVVDGDPSFWKHHGAYFGVDDGGNFVVDTSLGNSGGLGPSSGDSPNIPGANGNVSVNIPAGSSRKTQFVTGATSGVPLAVSTETLTVGGYTFDAKAVALAFKAISAAGNGLAVTGGGPTASAQIGDGSSHVAVAEALQALWSLSQAWQAGHVHVSGTGVTSPPTTAPPGYSPAVTSGAVSIPSRPL
jgi:hypothetical protein